MSDLFPRTTVGGVSVSRMIIGTNWLLGYSHQSPSADAMIKRSYDAKERFIPLLEAYLEHGVDTIMGPFGWAPELVDAIKETEQKQGKKIIMVETPVVNMDDTPEARREAEATIKACAERGATFCLTHQASTDQLVDKNKREITRIGDYTSMMREAGLIPGLSTHVPDTITYCDEHGYDVETYIQIYNALGFMMPLEIELISRIIHSAKKPVMTIKPMAAGRCTPYVGLNFSWHTIRDRDMVTVGAYSPDEAREDIEISFAAFEGRFPTMGMLG